jgi:hypothetical protein
MSSLIACLVWRSRRGFEMSRIKFRKVWPILLGLVIGIGFILLRNVINDNEYQKEKRIVDRNGIELSGTVLEIRYGDRYTTSRAIYSYVYKGRGYLNQDLKFVWKLKTNQTVLIKIDTTNPERSYIVDTFQ